MSRSLDAIKRRCRRWCETRRISRRHAIAITRDWFKFRIWKLPLREERLLQIRIWCIMSKLCLSLQAVKDSWCWNWSKGYWLYTMLHWPGFTQFRCYLSANERPIWNFALYYYLPAYFLKIFLFPLQDYQTCMSNCFYKMMLRYIITITTDKHAYHVIFIFDAVAPSYIIAWHHLSSSQASCGIFLQAYTFIFN